MPSWCLTKDGEEELDHGDGDYLKESCVERNGTNSFPVFLYCTYISALLAITGHCTA